MAMADRYKSRYLEFMADGGVKGGTEMREEKRGEFWEFGSHIYICRPLSCNHSFIRQYNLYVEVLSN
jgi:hypothetical protein